MPATCDDGDNDARDQQNEDDSRYISMTYRPDRKALAAWSVKLPELVGKP
jgi:hypothetical protein